MSVLIEEANARFLNALFAMETAKIVPNRPCGAERLPCKPVVDFMIWERLSPVWPAKVWTNRGVAA